MTWQDCTIGDVVTLQRGHDLTDNQRKSGTVPVIGSAGQNGFHDVAKMKGPGVTVGRSGASIGKVTYVDQDFWPHNTCLYAKDLKGNNPRFLSYFLSKLSLEQLNSGAAQPSLNRNFVHSVKIRFPDPQLQQRIASILSTYDDLIENNRRRIVLLEDATRLLYREWFIHFRFPGHEHVKIVDGVPEGWRTLALEELLVLQRGFDLPVAARKEGSVPVYGSTGIVGYHDTAKVTAPMLITGRSGSLGRVVFVSIPCWPLNTALWVKEFRRASPLFGYFLLTELGLEKFNGGASVPTLDRKVVHRLPVILPSTELLKSFDEQVKPSFEMIETLNTYSEQLTKARDLLLPRLMDGRLEA